jgi:hypothetical protein
MVTQISPHAAGVQIGNGKRVRNYWAISANNHACFDVDSLKSPYLFQPGSIAGQTD